MVNPTSLEPDVTLEIEEEELVEALWVTPRGKK